MLNWFKRLFVKKPMFTSASAYMAYYKKRPEPPTLEQLYKCAETINNQKALFTEWSKREKEEGENIRGAIR